MSEVPSANASGGAEDEASRAKKPRVEEPGNSQLGLQTTTDAGPRSFSSSGECKESKLCSILCTGMFVSEDVLLNAACFLTRREVVRCQLLSKWMRDFVDRNSSHLPRHYLDYVEMVSGISRETARGITDLDHQSGWLVRLEACHSHDAGASSNQRRTLTDLTQAGDVYYLLRNTKVKFLHIGVQVKEISRSGFVEELNNLQICVEQFSLGRPLVERYSPISDRQTSLVHSLASNAFLRWRTEVLFCGYIKSIASVPPFQGIKGVCTSFPDLPSDSALIERFIHAGYVTDLRILVEAWTHSRALATLEFYPRMISGFTTGFRLPGFDSVTASLQLTDSIERRVVVRRRQSDVRPVTAVRNQVAYPDGHRGLELRLFNSALVLDEQGNLCINDELRQAALNFL
ncbi:hypothetical protein AAVH_15550 [Aphelenchoides avenae]|nr:hypothetical protein AAVH_15550 [Aphelenchus avenae]